MADNFNLRTFLLENNLTKNAQLLNEELDTRSSSDEGIDLWIPGASDSEDPEGDAQFIQDSLAKRGIQSKVTHSIDEWYVELVDKDQTELAGDILHDIGYDYNKSEMWEGADDKGKMARTHVAYSASVTLGDEDGRQYVQHIRASVRKGEDAQQRAAQLIQKHFEEKAEKGDPFTDGKFIKINGIGKVLNPERSSIKEPATTENKKPIMKETKLTAKERRLVEMVNNAMGFSEGEENPNHEFGTNAVTGEPLPNPNDTMVVEDEMPDETVIPEYNSIDELMKSIDHGTNKVAEEHKIQEMKKIADALRTKAKKMEESEHAAHINPKDLMQLTKDAAALDKAAAKYQAAYEKQFNKKEKAAAPKKEKKETVEALQEGTFDLRKFLAENRK